MGLVKKEATSRLVAANRANSRKSTGPRSREGKRRVARNAGRHFVFAQITPSRMEGIGEDPEEFERLRESLRSAISPRDGFEEMLVEAMAVNRWRLGRLLQAEMGNVWRERASLEAERFGFLQRAPGSDNLMLDSFGLAGVQNSPLKFIQLVDLLRTVRLKVETEGFTAQGLELLRTIYGEQPDVPGFALTVKFKALMPPAEVAPDDEDGPSEPEAEDEQPAESEPAPPPADASGPETDVAPCEQEQAGPEEAAALANARQDFVASLDREIEIFSKLGKSDALARLVPTSEALMDTCLIPSKDDIEQILRYETMLQREFERLQKQLHDWRRNQRRVRRQAAKRLMLT